MELLSEHQNGAQEEALCVCVWGGVGGQGKLLEEVVQNYFEVQGGL